MDPLFVASVQIALRADFRDNLPYLDADLRYLVENQPRRRSASGRHALEDALGLMFPRLTRRPVDY
jgi:hypothetical protein